MPSCAPSVKILVESTKLCIQEKAFATQDRPWWGNEAILLKCWSGSLPDLDLNSTSRSLICGAAGGSQQSGRQRRGRILLREPVKQSCCCHLPALLWEGVGNADVASSLPRRPKARYPSSSGLSGYFRFTVLASEYQVMVFAFGKVSIVFNECQKFLFSKITPGIKTNHYLLEAKSHPGSCALLRVKGFERTTYWSGWW